MSAKEGHSSIADWGLPLGLMAVVIAPWCAKWLTDETLRVHWLLSFISRNAWHISVAGICGFIVMMFWHSFERFEDKDRELQSLKKEIASDRDSRYQRVLQSFLAYNTTDKVPLRVLIASGVLELKTEEETSRLFDEITKRRGYDPFPDFEAVPEGKKLRALREIRDRQIAIEEPQQMVDFLAEINDIPRRKIL